MEYRVFWFNKVVNIGDLITPYLLDNLFKVNYRWVDSMSPVYKYMSTGSILHRSNSRSIVWGSGSISKSLRIKGTPKILGVRGPLTRELVIRHGIECPDVYGDPGLLLPNAYTPDVIKTHKIGVIPHYVDVNTPFIKYCRNNPDIKVINVMESNVEEFINQVVSCETIMSSSLHGLIISDAYNIPSVWIKLSNNIIGDGFKFRDYYKSINRNVSNPMIPNSTNYRELLLDINTDYSINIDHMLKKCPFK